MDPLKKLVKDKLLIRIIMIMIICMIMIILIIRNNGNTDNTTNYISSSSSSNSYKCINLAQFKHTHVQQTLCQCTRAGKLNVSLIHMVAGFKVIANLSNTYVVVLVKDRAACPFSQFCEMDTGVREQSTPPEKRTLRKMGFQSTKSGGGEHFLLQDCMTKACVEGIVVSQTLVFPF